MATLSVPSKETLSAAPMPAPAPAPTQERLVRVKLLHDVWLEAIDPETGGKYVKRYTTNTPVLDDNGSPMVNKKTRAPIVTIEEYDLPVSIAQKLVDLEKARAVITL